MNISIEQFNVLTKELAKKVSQDCRDALVSVVCNDREVTTISADYGIDPLWLENEKRNLLSFHEEIIEAYCPATPVRVERD
jgi:hypothetical protein